MTILTINTGSSANKGDGDTLRASFTKINQNFAYLANFTNTNNATTVTTGIITFDTSTISAPNETIISIETKNAGGEVISKIISDPLDERTRLESWTVTDTRELKQEWSDWTTGTWVNNGYGYGRIRLLEAYNVVSFWQNTIYNADSESVQFSINGGPFIPWDGSSSTNPDTGFFEIYSGNLYPAELTTVTSLTFTYRSLSSIEVGSGGIGIDAHGDLNLGASGTIYAYPNFNFEVSTQNSVNLSGSSGADLSSNNNTNVSGYNSLQLNSSGAVTLSNRSATNPVSIIASEYNADKRWDFNVDGSLTFPDLTVQSTAYPGTGLVRVNTIPETSTSTGVTNQVAFTGTDMYVCIAPDTWVKFTGTAF